MDLLINQQYDLSFHQDVKELANKLKLYSHLRYIGIYCKSNRNFIVTYHACQELNFCLFLIQYAADPYTEAHRIGLEAYIYENRGKLEVLSLSSNQRFLLPPEAFIVFRTSGSTGSPKFIVHSKNNLTYQTRATFNHLGYQESDRLAIHLPLWCAYGLSLVSICQYYSLDMICIDKMHPREIIMTLKESKATTFDCAPSLYGLLLAYIQKFPSIKEGLKVRMWCCGGDILNYALASQWQEIMGSPLLDGYGLSEAGPNVALNSLTRYKMGTVGTLMKDIEANISEDGEIHLKSPSLMLGTLSPENLTFEPYHEKLLATGDIGEIDFEGYLKITGRKKNIIVINGFNFSPEVIEKHIMNCSNVKNIVVSSISLNYKEKMVFVVVPENSQSFSTDLFLQECKKYLPEKSIPKKIFLFHSLPYTTNGKIDRIKIRMLLHAGETC